METESSAAAKGEAPLVATPGGKQKKSGGLKKVLGIVDFLLRLAAIIAALAAAATMGTSDQTLPFFAQFFQLQASYDDLPTFMFFVIAMAVVAGYLVLSLIFAVVTILRPNLLAVKLLLLILDIVALTLAAAAGAAAEAIVYLAHNGNPKTSWQAICQQFGDFCQKVSGAVVASFVTIVLLIMLILLSGFALLKKH